MTPLMQRISELVKQASVTVNDVDDDLPIATPRPPLSQAELKAFEGSLGFTLPDLLRELYTEVGDGGFGPEYGFLSIRADVPSYLSMPLRLAEALEPGDDAQPAPVWRKGLIPLAYWGCDVYSLVDCLDPANPVLRYDGDYHVFQLEQGETPTWQLESPALEVWLQDWVDGKVNFDMPEPAQS